MARDRYIYNEERNKRVNFRDTADGLEILDKSIKKLGFETREDWYNQMRLMTIVLAMKDRPELDNSEINKLMMERQRIELLIQRKFLTKSEGLELKHSKFIQSFKKIPNVNTDIIDFECYEIKALQLGYLPIDEDIKTLTHEVYVRQLK